MDFIMSKVFTLLGTHSFFLYMLPMLFLLHIDEPYFGYEEALDITIIILSGVVYTCTIKDYFCSPRPFAISLGPKRKRVERLLHDENSYHKYEYGLPSTHSATSFSVFYYVMMKYSSSMASIPWIDLSSLWSFVSNSGILYTSAALIYGVGVPLSRIYCGMHSMLDITVGALVGVFAYYAYTLVIKPLFVVGILLDLVAGLGSYSFVLSFLISAAVIGTIVVYLHPEPSCHHEYTEQEICPCYEDEVSCAAVLVGVLSGVVLYKSYLIKGFGLENGVKLSDFTLSYNIN
ncbi:hypothetical protein MP638_001806, partial [Amoeboaphelidium occidentale]